MTVPWTFTLLNKYNTQNNLSNFFLQNVLALRAPAIFGEQGN